VNTFRQFCEQWNVLPEEQSALAMYLVALRAKATLDLAGHPPIEVTQRTSPPPSHHGSVVETEMLRNLQAQRDDLLQQLDLAEKHIQSLHSWNKTLQAEKAKLQRAVDGQVTEEISGRLHDALLRYLTGRHEHWPRSALRQAIYDAVLTPTDANLAKPGNPGPGSGATQPANTNPTSASQARDRGPQ
jgi:hypothetical protein